MFCPNCKNEYRPGFTVCADCRVKLVESLPEEKTEEIQPDPNLKFVELLRTESLTDIAQIHAVLDAAEIQYFIQDEIMNTIRPMGQFAMVLVAEDDAERAAELLKDVKLEYVRTLWVKK